MDQILRAFSATVDDVDASDRSIVAKISTGDVDRHRTIIASSGVKFENYRRNPVVLFEHGKSPNRGPVPIGRNVWIKADGKGTGRIIAKTKFSTDDFSDLLFSFYKDGTMSGWSISALPEEASVPSREEIRSRTELKDCDLIYRAADLLEYSAVSVPSCASALSDSELRSLSTLVVRGFWTPPEEVAPLIRALDESAETAVEDVESETAEVERSADGVEAVVAEPDAEAVDDPAVDEVVKRSEPEHEPAVEAEPVVRDLDFGNAFHVLARDHQVTPDQFRRMTISQIELMLAGIQADAEVDRTTPEPIIPETPVEPPAPEPDPVPEPVDPLAGLPPLVGRSLEDVSRRNAAKVDAWADSVRAMFDEFRGWARGEG